MHTRLTALIVACGLAAPCSAQVCESAPPTELISVNAAGYAHAGRSVAAGGDFLVIGAYNDGRMGVGAGSVAVYRKSGGVWTEEADLTRSPADPGAWFGYCVATDAQRIVIGAPYARTPTVKTGAASVYRFETGTGWVLEQTITPPSGAASDLFGWSVAISGDRLLAGSPGRNTGVGADAGVVYAYRYNGAAWVLEQTLAGAAAAGADFGHAVALDGDLALVGAPGDAPMTSVLSGRVHAYEHSESGWSPSGVLSPAEPQTGDDFGWSVSLRGTRAAVGSPGDPVNASNTGRAHVYGFDTGQWTMDVSLPVPSQSGGNGFGRSVALADDTLFVGLTAEAGLVWVHPRGNGNWSPDTTLSPSHLTNGSAFGVSLAYAGGTLVVGAENTDAPDTNAGSAFVYSAVCPCPADLSGDGVLNFFDVSVFLSAFNDEQPTADLAEPFGSFDFFDVAAFLSSFNQGCP